MLGQQLLDRLVQAPQVPVPEGDADQRRDNTLGDRADVVTVAGGDALPVALVHQIAMADHEDAADLGIELGDLVSRSSRTAGSIPCSAGAAVFQPAVGQ
jgi:hypothetical protein